MIVTVGNQQMKKLRSHSRVHLVDDERASGNGIIVTLTKGWSIDPLRDNRVFGEDSPSRALATVRRAVAFSGPYEE